MAWFVVSVPIWLTGGFCLLAAVAEALQRQPVQPGADFRKEVSVGLALAGVFFCIAALVMGA